MPIQNKLLKIAMILDDGLDKPDGVQQYILAVGEWMRRQGHEVDYLVGETKRKDIANVYSLSRNIGVHSNGNYMSIPLPTRKKKLKALLKSKKYDVLHVQTPYSPFMGERLILLADKSTAVVGTFHILPNSFYISIGNTLLGLWCRHSLRRFDKMLSVSDVAAVFAKKTFHIDSEVLPNVVDFERFNKATPFEKYNDGVTNILYLGRLVPRKGCMTLLKAINVLKAKHQELPEYRVIVCGSGPEEHRLKSYVAEHGLSDIVTFEGFVNEEDKPSYYASADISVFPSTGGESFGIVLIEAMASGRSVVLGGNNPGYKSVLGPKPELLFNAKNPAALAGSLKNLLSGSNNAEIKEWAAKYAKSFDTEIIGSQLLAIYDRALLKRHKE